MEAPSDHARVYSATARRLHWWTVAFVAVLIPLGVYMHHRGNTLNIWDGTTNALYNTHKFLGFLLLWLVLARLIYRIRHGAPADEPTLLPWQKLASHVTHWGIYGLLVIVPMLGWLGVSRYGATNIVGPISLPSIAAQDQASAEWILWLHGTAAKILALLIAAHIGAALMHYLIFKDRVMNRMLPGLKSRADQ